VVLLRPWLTDQSFLSGMAISQILPGANVTNMAVYIGQNVRRQIDLDSFGLSVRESLARLG